MNDCLEELSPDREMSTCEAIIISLAFPSMSSLTLKKEKIKHIKVYDMV